MKLGQDKWTIEEVVAVACGACPPVQLGDEAWRRKLEASAAFLERQWREEGVVYGVTTGYGDSCDVHVPFEEVEQLPRLLARFHGCGMGAILSEEEALAVVTVQLASISQGFSGVRPVVVERLLALLEHRIAPVIPEEGSVGASGDLTPLSYVAAVLMGERDVLYQGERRSAQDVWSSLDIEPLVLRPKETLALMNGTAMMTALACQAFLRAEYLTRLASRLTALAVVGLQGNREHFEPALFALKPHPGQVQSAHRIYTDLSFYTRLQSHRLQDRYSLRCAPHVIGVLADFLPWSRQCIETELNSVHDNPLIDAEAGKVMHGGHFYGGHIAFVMDGLKTAVANVADLLDRQLAMIVDPKMNHGLPANLSGAPSQQRRIHHGLKAVQIGASAWTAEALKQTMPASVFSRSTESHNQDKVSMGTIAARDCLRVLQLTEQVTAAHLIAVAQGVALRHQQQELPQTLQDSPLLDWARSLQSITPFLAEDRPLEQELRALVGCIQQRHWELYDAETSDVSQS